MSAPTLAPGETSPVPRRASASACCMLCSSFSESAIAVAGSVGGEQRVGKILRIKRQQIAGLFAHAHIAHRQPQLARDGYHYTAFGCSIQFGKDNAGYACSVSKLPCLLQAILPRGRV